MQWQLEASRHSLILEILWNPSLPPPRYYGHLFCPGDWRNAHRFFLKENPVNALTPLIRPTTIFKTQRSWERGWTSLGLYDHSNQLCSAFQPTLSYWSHYIYVDELMLYDLIEVSIFLILRAGSTVNLAGRENFQFYHFFPRESHRNV